MTNSDRVASEKLSLFRQCTMLPEMKSFVTPDVINCVYVAMRSLAMFATYADSTFENQESNKRSAMLIKASSTI